MNSDKWSINVLVLLWGLNQDNTEVFSVCFVSNLGFSREVCGGYFLIDLLKRARKVGYGLVTDLFGYEESASFSVVTIYPQINYWCSILML